MSVTQTVPVNEKDTDRDRDSDSDTVNDGDNENEVGVTEKVNAIETVTLTFRGTVTVLETVTLTVQVTETVTMTETMAVREYDNDNRNSFEASDTDSVTNATNQRQCAFFFPKGDYPVSVVQAGHHRSLGIDRQSAQQTAHWKLQIAFHSLSHFTLTTTQLNISFLKTFNYYKMIQRLVHSFRNFHLCHSNVTKS